MDKNRKRFIRRSLIDKHLHRTGIVNLRAIVRQDEYKYYNRPMRLYYK